MSAATRRRVERPGKKRLFELIGRFDGTVVGVLGDLVLDEFVYGEIARVSREAPVLILQHRESRVVPGGAANSVANLRALGASPLPVGRTGADDTAERLLGVLEGMGVDCSGVTRDSSCSTPLKSRILAGSAHTAKQQIVRIDRGQPGSAPAPRVRARIGRELARLRRRATGLLIADYGYGSVDPAQPELAAWLEDPDRTVTLDSRFRLRAFSNVTAATPNIAELETATGTAIGDDDPGALEKAGARLRHQLRARAIVVTRGSRGMSLLEKGRPALHIPCYGTDEVADVTGAGDTVAAVFTLAILAGGSFLEATILANYAGGIVVMKRGTATVSPAELSAAVESDP